MFVLYSVILALVLYGIFQYLIARWGDTYTFPATRHNIKAIVYSLSLAVFCTSWTYYGNIAQASSQGIHHIALYLGASLAFVLLTPIFKQMVRIKKVYHSTSIADFISTRYNHSGLLAGLISIICLIGITPYIAIQLKSIITSFSLFVPSNMATNSGVIDYLDIFVVLLTAVFTIGFGVRKLDPTERHPGMMVALAAESLFKLFAFLLSGLLICFVLFGGISDILSQTTEQLTERAELAVFTQMPSASAWFASMALGAIGVIALPRQFHCSVVECEDETLIDSAKWQFPLYLFVINLLVLPIAMAGMLYLPNDQSKDLMLLAIPLQEGELLISILVFLGGFAASTGMIMVCTMTLSTMFTNHLVVPIIERFSVLNPLRHYLLIVRWAAVFILLTLGLYYYRAIGDSELIVRIGSISFVAVAQFIPALVGGMVWRHGNLYGAVGGISIGALVWFYTAMLPSLAGSGWLPMSLVENGLAGIAWLRPEALFGLAFESTIAHSLFMSLLFNVCAYILLSTLIVNKEQQQQYLEFINIAKGVENAKAINIEMEKNIELGPKLSLIEAVYRAYLPEQKVQEKLLKILDKQNIQQVERIDILQLAQLKANTTHSLAGIIGMAAAQKAVERYQLIIDHEQTQLAKCYAKLLEKAALTPQELLEKVDFFQEKQKLLESHAYQQETIIRQLQREKQATNEAKTALSKLNQELEVRVEQRTKQLTLSNDELSETLEKLTVTQNQLLEAEKMASLGRVVAGVAHEINTPLGIVITAISNLAEIRHQLFNDFEQEKLSKNQLAEALDQMAHVLDLGLRNINRSAELINSFKQLAIDDSEKLIEFNINSCLSDLVAAIKPSADEQHCTIKFSCSDKLTVYSYYNAWHRLLSNLIVNSMQHGASDARELAIEIHVELQNEQLVISYSDNGKGLNEEEASRIFEPFYTTQRHKGKVGLGAHLIYNLVVQKLEGAIKLLPTEKGFAVSIILPFKSSKPVGLAV